MTRFWLTVGAMLLASADAIPPGVVPQPQSITYLGSNVTLSSQLVFTATGEKSPILSAAISRYDKLLSGGAVVHERQDSATFTRCTVDVSDPSLSLDLDTDESYTLDLDATKCTVVSKTVFGAMHGMESLVQLIQRPALTAPAVHIEDEPRFAFRATMIDTARHFYPVQFILDHLDAMAAVKMNVLHWHLVDIESFPYVSKAFPQLSEHGAYHPREVYTADDIAKVVSYAMDRGIRVIPEIDTPGHVWAGFAAIDGLLTTCYDGDEPVGTGPLDPSKESTFEFLTTLLAELGTLFPDKMFMVGGDEVDFGCWESNADVQSFVASKGWGTNTTGSKELESYYAQRLLSILANQNSSVMCWEELFDNGLKLAPETIINVWKGGWEWCSKPMSGSTAVQSNATCTAEFTGNAMKIRNTAWRTVMAKATAAGFGTVLSSPFYLNVINQGSNFNEDWPFYYSVEPTSFDAPDELRREFTEDEKERSVLGVEACMWSEWVDGSNFAGRFWPRAAAVAERGWSTKQTTSIDDFRRRVHSLTCEFKGRGLPAEPVVSGGRFFYENGTLCSKPGVRVLGPPKDGCWPRFSSCSNGL